MSSLSKLLNLLIWMIDHERPSRRAAPGHAVTGRTGRGGRLPVQTSYADASRGGARAPQARLGHCRSRCRGERQIEQVRSFRARPGRPHPSAARRRGLVQPDARANGPGTGCQGRPWRLLPDHRGHDNRKQSLDSFRANSFLMELAARRVTGIVRRHAGTGRLAVVVQLGIARGLTRGRALWLRLVHGLRTLLVPRLLFTALISDDALVGMGHDSSRLFAVSKRLRAGASKVPTREIRLLTVR